ncbi:MAG TPA: DUF58 domain-containing protein [Cyclobacteriaceae bacterium]|nr:DUF58 domain-containing protein [Cyclobacteriaceae bacterium]
MAFTLDKTRQTGSLELLAKQLVEGFITGLHKSPYHGFSVEFAEHRLYNEGQSTRHIDWKVFARTDRLYTKQYEEETNLRCLIVLDCSSSMYYPADTLAKLKFSIYASSALAYLLHKQRDAVGLCLFSESIDELTPIKSTASHLDKLFSLLERTIHTTAKQKKTRVSEVLHEVAEKTHKRSLIIIFSDMFDGGEDEEDVFKSLQHLKHNKHEVLLFHVSDHETELDFNFEDRPYEFVDLESGTKLKLNPSEIKGRYTKAQEEFHKRLQYKCNQLKIDFIAANTQTDYFSVLQSYLIKRSKMK